jgi:hypothetical protein
MILKLLKKVALLLEQKHIEYMLSGSIALNNYSIPRMTLDIDIIVELNESNLNDFFFMFNEGYYINKETVKTEIKRKGMFNVIDFETGFKIDFILRKNTEFRIHEFSRKKRVKIADFGVWIVSVEDLIISKIEWIQILQSDKQITDIKNLLHNSKIDVNYVNDWCRKLKLNTFDLL